MNKTVIRSIGAVAAGLLLIVILSIATDGMMVKMGMFPPLNQGTYSTTMLFTALLYRSIYGVLGGYVTARIAPFNPIKHAVILGLIGTVLSIIGAIACWNLSAHWYPVALVITALPTCWLGGRLRKMNI